MTVFVVAFILLVVVLYALIASINHGDHFAPQAYYRRKRGGAPIAHGFESLAPRYRKKLPGMEPPEEPGG
jgi:hypothetical protein